MPCGREEKSGNTGILRSRWNGRPAMIRQETTAYHRIGEQEHIPNAGTIEWKEPRSMGPEDREELV
mgnify:CR=1 FL=1